MKSIRYLIVLSLLGWSALTAQLTKDGSEGYLFHYDIRPISMKGGMEFKVSLGFNSNNAIQFDVPQDYYGVDHYQQYFHDFTPLDGTILEDTEKKHTKRLRPNGEGQIHLSYTLRLSKEAMDRHFFAPGIASSSFHLAGSQIILPIGIKDMVNTYHIRILEVPSEWNFYSSFSATPKEMEFTGSYWSLMTTAFGGGDQKMVSFEVKGRPVSIFVQGDYTHLDEGILIKKIKELVRFQRDWTLDYSQPYYNISVIERPNGLNGTAPENLFVCFVDPESTAHQILKVISHEIFHYWLPNKVQVQTEKGESDLKYAWFYEGFTEYFSRNILYEMGILTLDEYVDTFNTDIFLIANNDQGNIRYKKMLDIRKKKGLGTNLHKLSYHRGNLMALRWESQIRSMGSEGSLKKFFLEVLDHCGGKDGYISFDDFTTLGSRYGLQIEEDFEEYILKGRPIGLPQNAFEGSFNLARIEMPSYDRGFDFDRGDILTLTNIKRGSNAYKAGLRNGMEFLTAKNAYRFRTSWLADRPVEVKVRTKDGSEKRYSYFPEGKDMKLQQYLPK